MKPIYLLCLHGVRTGGPEAIHQLSDALIEQGFDARMVYYTWAQIAALEIATPQSAYFFGERPVPYTEYERYRVNIADSVPNSPDCVVVLPETLCHLAPKFDKATVLVWWLSVDNGFGALSKVNLNHLRKPNVKHAAQSVYANRFVVSLGLRPPPGAFLSDYIQLPDDEELPSPFAPREALAVFNATSHKIAHDLNSIMRAVERRGVRVSQIANLPKSEVLQLLRRARVYVDLGCQPGKDRMPREAQLMQCYPLLLKAGAAEAGDFGEWTMIEPDWSTEEIAALVEGVALSAGSGIAELPPEKPRFLREVRNVFSDL